MQVADLGLEPRFVPLQTSLYYNAFSHLILIQMLALQPCDRVRSVTNNRHTTSSQPVGIKKNVYLLDSLTSHDELYMGEMTVKCWRRRVCACVGRFSVPSRNVPMKVCGSHLKNAQ